VREGVRPGNVHLSPVHLTKRAGSVRRYCRGEGPSYAWWGECEGQSAIRLLASASAWRSMNVQSSGDPKLPVQGRCARRARSVIGGGLSRLSEPGAERASSSLLQPRGAE